MNAEVWDGLVKSWIDFRDDPEVWVAIVSAVGDKAFSSGQDLKEVMEWMKIPEDKRPAQPLPEVNPMRGLETYKPVIAAINGICTGGNFTVHGEIDGLLIENNSIEQDVSTNSCLGFSIIPGYTRPQWFRNVVVRGNTIVNVGTCSVCAGSAPGILIDNNIFINTSGRPQNGVMIPIGRKSYGDDDPPSFYRKKIRLVLHFFSKLRGSARSLIFSKEKRSGSWQQQSSSCTGGWTPGWSTASTSESSTPLGESELRQLRLLLADGFFAETVTATAGLAGERVIEVGHRLNFATAWSSNMVSICRATGLAQVTRVERSRRYLVPAAADLQAFIAARHDRMTDCPYAAPLTTFATGIIPAQVYEVDLLNGGPDALAGDARCRHRFAMQPDAGAQGSGVRRRALFDQWRDLHPHFFVHDLLNQGLMVTSPFAMGRK